jgi:hypothetical protein
MNRDAVREYVEQSDAVLESSPQMDEANTNYGDDVWVKGNDLERSVSVVELPIAG